MYLWSACTVALFPLQTLRAPRSPAPSHPPDPHTARYRTHRLHSACVRLSTARGGLQPASNLRHVPRHKHVRHVLGEPPRALPPSASDLQSPPASRGTQLAPHRLPCLRDRRQTARVFNQPLSFDLSSVTDMSYIFWNAPLSAANKLLIRCAWAGSAFDSAASVPYPSNPSAVYGSGWAPGSCA